MNKEKISELLNQIEYAVAQLKIEMGLKLTKKTEKFKDYAQDKKSKIQKGTKKHYKLLDEIKNIEFVSDKYPIIKNSDPVLIKCLFILDVIKNEPKIKDISAAQIEIIAPYFNKLKISRQAARYALDNHPELVGIRRKGPKEIFYYIKEGGIKYYRKPKQNGTIFK